MLIAALGSATGTIARMFTARPGHRAHVLPSRWLLMLLALAGTLHAQDKAADADFVRHFPSPEQVRTDIADRRGDAKPEELVGREAGRLLMLGQTLEQLYGGNLRRAPAAVQALHADYLKAYERIHGNERQALIAEDCSPPTRLLGNCVRENYLKAEGDYKFGLDATVEAAELYMPEAYRSRFIDASPGQLTRKWTAENRARRAAGADDAQAEGAGMGLGTWLLVGGGALLALLLFAVLRPRQRGPSRTLEELQTSVRTGTVVDSNLWSETRFTSTTQTSGGGGHIHGGTGYVAAPQSTTTVNSHAVENLRLFVREDDGTEFDASFSELGFGARNGHRVSVIFAAFPNDQGALAPQPMALVNHSTQKHKMLWGRVSWIVKNDRKLSEQVLAHLRALTQQVADAGSPSPSPLP